MPSLALSPPPGQEKDNPEVAALLAYEGFETGAAGYTADALLYGQTYQGFGEASGTWTVGTIGNTNSAVVSSTGLKHVVVDPEASRQ